MGLKTDSVGLGVAYVILILPHTFLYPLLNSQCVRVTLVPRARVRVPLKMPIVETSGQVIPYVR